MTRIRGVISSALVATAMSLFVIIPIVAAQAKPRERVLYTFTGGNDGGQPHGRLLRDASGNLYGTAYMGGTNYAGVVFKLTPQGKETVLHSFSTSEGYYPVAGLIADQNGNFYGTTFRGGVDDYGTVFRLSASNKVMVLYSFTGGSDGGHPEAPVIRDDDGNLYGTAVTGGANLVDGGVVFKVTPKGKETVVYAFMGGNDGKGPYAGLLMDSKGNLYGAAIAGGAGNAGVVYEVTKGKEKVLYTFTNGNDGGNPLAGLIEDQTGHLYGTTSAGGDGGGGGVVYKLAPKGKETPLYGFNGSTDDGGYSDSVLTMDAAGNLYGTTTGLLGGGHGVVFELTPKGEESVLHAFTGGNDGAVPQDLTMDGHGNLYGVTQQGGDSNAGTVFEVMP